MRFLRKCSADQTGSDYWDFAVEAGSLMALGLTFNDFRWLVRKGLVEHQREVMLESDDCREFRPNGVLTFPECTCFVLTRKGVLLARGGRQSTVTHDGPNTESPGSENQEGSKGALDGPQSANGQSGSESGRPSWDPERRILRVNGTIVKQFKWTAENQEAILGVFEEEGWPPRVDDPLPPHPKQDSKRRLSDTIKCLNRKQDNSILHFRGDGSGEGVIWELVEQDDSDDDVPS